MQERDRKMEVISPFPQTNDIDTSTETNHSSEMLTTPPRKVSIDILPLIADNSQRKPKIKKRLPAIPFITDIAKESEETKQFVHDRDWSIQ